jgi:hypothetical protein
MLPGSNVEEARSAGDLEIELVPVETFGEALAYLQGNE